MAEAAAAPPPLGTKVGYNADGKRVVLKCSMCVPDICIAPSKRPYIRNKKEKLLWQAELGCYYCSRCLAHAEGHATRINSDRRAGYEGSILGFIVRPFRLRIDLDCMCSFHMTILQGFCRFAVVKSHFVWSAQANSTITSKIVLFTRKKNFLVHNTELQFKKKV
jgi:hypothetical protein